MEILRPALFAFSSGGYYETAVTPALRGNAAVGFSVGCMAALQVGNPASPFAATKESVFSAGSATTGWCLGFERSAINTFSIVGAAYDTNAAAWVPVKCTLTGVADYGYKPFHIVMTYDGTLTTAALKLYVNGTLRNTANFGAVGTYAVATSKARIGYPINASQYLTTETNAIVYGFGYRASQATTPVLSDTDITNLYQVSKGAKDFCDLSSPNSWYTSLGVVTPVWDNCWSTLRGNNGVGQTLQAGGYARGALTWTDDIGGMVMSKTLTDPSVPIPYMYALPWN
jgi:hypothetical protein